jgi:peptidoglycan/LPS O-acetylase OafA/YrhL
LLYGHLSVVVFIVVSGFSLAVAPAGREWRLRGLSRFAHRRAWRILPPYWAALTLSLALAWLVVPQPDTGEPTLRSVVVFGSLLQDVFGAPSPNGAFWSIAVEAHLYLGFPLLLLVRRRLGALVTVGATVVPVIALGLLAPRVPVLGEVMRLTPQFAVLFALGLVTAGVLRGGDKARPVPWHWLAILAGCPILVTLALRGPRWWDAHLFWIDLVTGPAAALLIAAIATRSALPLVRVLDARPLRELGLFSYSLYLIHAPIVVSINEKIIKGRIPEGLPTLAATLAVAVPASVGAAWLFSKLFEIPFQRHRDWKSLRVACQRRLQRPRRPAVSDQ